jgi:hypothetical protein
MVGARARISSGPSTTDPGRARGSSELPPTPKSEPRGARTREHDKRRRVPSQVHIVWHEPHVAAAHAGRVAQRACAEHRRAAAGRGRVPGHQARAAHRPRGARCGRCQGHESVKLGHAVDGGRPQRALRSKLAQQALRAGRRGGDVVCMPRSMPWQIWLAAEQPGRLSGRHSAAAGRAGAQAGQQAGRWHGMQGSPAGCLPARAPCGRAPPPGRGRASAALRSSTASRPSFQPGAPSPPGLSSTAGRAGSRGGSGVVRARMGARRPHPPEQAASGGPEGGAGRAAPPDTSVALVTRQCGKAQLWQSVSLAKRSAVPAHLVHLQHVAVLLEGHVAQRALRSAQLLAQAQRARGGGWSWR